MPLIWCLRIQVENNYYLAVYSLPHGPTAPSGPRSHYRDFTQTHTHAVGLLWTRDQLVAETSTSQHTTLTIFRHPCAPRRDFNPQAHDASGRVFTPYTALSLGSALSVLYVNVFYCMEYRTCKISLVVNRSKLILQGK